MDVIIYESSSTGGCYQYAKALHQAYRGHKEVERATLLLPRNTNYKEAETKAILLRDNKKGARIHFMWRHFMNPLLLFIYLVKRGALKRKGAPVMVLLNDFEQMSAPIWAPLYRLFPSRLLFVLFLHDSNRDDYPPSPRLSSWCMKRMLKAIDLVLYHGQLPDKPYYHPNGRSRYKKVNHGIYTSSTASPELKERLKQARSGIKHLLTIPGNIREEKNYAIALEAIKKQPQFGLLIAGSRANSGVYTDDLHQKVKEYGIEQRVIWIERYLSDEEMSAVLEESDFILLNYSSTFHAQSGILNLAAPFRKPIIASNLPNALTDSVIEYNLGYICEPDNVQSLQEILLQLKQPSTAQWERFIKENDWSSQVEEVIKELSLIK